MRETRILRRTGKSPGFARGVQPFRSLSACLLGTFHALRSTRSRAFDNLPQGSAGAERYRHIPLTAANNLLVGETPEPTLF